MLDRISQSLSVPMPEAETMDAYLDKILPEVRQWSEDLNEEQFYLGKPWLEIRDDENFHQSILHFFNEGGEYLKSVDGNASGSRWRYIESANKMLLGGEMDGELYDLAFLDHQFFILRKHGDQSRLGKRKYFVMVYEPLAKRIEWRDAMELLFDKSSSSSGFYVMLAVIVVLVMALLLLLR